MPAEPRQTETREPMWEGVLKAADLRTHIETLFGRSKAYREALERQEQVSVVLGELRAQIAQLQEREAELAGELEQLETTTNDPFARETTEELDTIRKLLGQEALMNPIQAIVQKVITDGRHGPYAVALSGDGARRNITFSIKSDVWQESSLPEQGSYVILSRLQKKRTGWRAMSGRFLIPADEQSAPSKERTEQ